MMNGTYGQTHFDGGDHRQHSNGAVAGVQHLNANGAPANNGAASANQQRTLYVGNLNNRTTEDQLLTCFGPYGNILSLKLFVDVNEPFCFIEYEKPEEASIAMSAMDKRRWVEKDLKVNWAMSVSNSQQQGGTGNGAGGVGGGSSKTELSKHSHIFVGDLAPEIDSTHLMSAFSPFGEISDCRVVRDSNSNKSKCYGFVSFVQRQHAENAISKMNGQVLGTRPIRTNWASRRPTGQRTDQSAAAAGHVPQQNGRSMSYEEIYNQSGPTNATVYCGGIFNGLTEELIQRFFRPFGTIQDIRVFKDKGYAFVRFANKESATNAILAMNNQDIHGQTIKCSWGKGDQDTTGPGSAAAAASVAMLNQHPAHAHLPANLNAAAAAAAAAAASTNYLYNPYGQMGTPFWYTQPTMPMPQGLPQAMHYGMPYPGAGQFYPSSSPSAHHNGFMMGAQMAAMQQQQQQQQQAQQQQPPTTPNGVAQSSQGGQQSQHPNQAPVTPQAHHHHHPQHPSSANVQTHHHSQGPPPPPQQPNGAHFGAYQSPPQMMAYTQMQ